MTRLIAVLMLFFPGLVAAFGIKLMRDSVFDEFYTILINNGIQFIVGLILFLAGIAFIGGFIFHRDRKRQLTQKPKNM